MYTYLLCMHIRCIYIGVWTYMYLVYMYMFVYQYVYLADIWCLVFTFACLSLL